MQQNYDLSRFLTMQNRIAYGGQTEYECAYAEMEEGCKRSHWIWYIFPQQKGLGRSYNSEYYGLDGKEEARAYMEHPVLGQRLRDISRLLLKHKDTLSIRQIMGSAIDVMKLQTSMRLFNSIAPDDVFQEVLETFF